VTAELKTTRLDLEPVRESHADEAWKSLNDERLWRYFPRLRPQTINDLRTLYRRWEYAAPGDEVWLNWLCRERRTGVLVGGMQATVRERRVAYIAYAFYPANQRKGYAREAAGAVIDHLCQAYAVTHVRAEMDTRNEASFRLVESLGFARVATQPAPDLGQGPAQEFVYELACLTR
jgi:ribosomal-protein-alanine N-acetyltransferase